MQLNILIASLQPPDLVPSLTSILEFLDNCITRLAKALVHYQDLACEYFHMERITEVPDLIVAAVIEQWPFYCKRKDLPTQERIAKWIARFFSGLVKYSAVKHDLSELETLLTTHSEAEAARIVIGHAFKGDVMGSFEEESCESSTNSQQDLTMNARQDISTEIQEADALQNWRSKMLSQQNLPSRKRLDLEDLESVISNNHLKDNIRLLCSQQEDVRLQSFDELSRFLPRLMSSPDPNWRLLAVTIIGITETAKAGSLAETPFPSVLAQFGCNFVDVWTDPLHLMYPKVNRFLLKAPVWERKKMITYWIDKVILKDSEGDDTKISEKMWLLDVLVQGLHTMQVGLHHKLLAIDLLRGLAS